VSPRFQLRAQCGVASASRRQDDGGVSSARSEQIDITGDQVVLVMMQTGFRELTRTSKAPGQSQLPLDRLITIRDAALIAIHLRSPPGR